MTIEANIICDSIGPNQVRLTTFVLKYPRFIHCFDEQTEVLCEIDGFKKFIPWAQAVATQPRLANYHIDGMVSFSQPAAWIINDAVNEEMVEINSQRISMLVTKGHRLFVGNRKPNRDEWEVIKAEEMLSEHTQKRFKTFGYINEGINIGKLANLIGFFIGNGTLVKNQNQAVFHLKKKRKIEYLCNLLTELNILYDVREHQDGTVNVVIRAHLDVFKECYVSDGQKKIPKLIHGVNSNSFISVLDGLWNSDGSTDKGYLKVFNTSSEYVADALCTLASIHGMRINFKKSYGENHPNHRKNYKLTNCTESQPIISRDKHPAKVVKYTGKVYCATVETGLLIIRRNGLVHISGNCEFMTHRVFSRNASSSRAIPVKKSIELIEQDMAIPLEFRKNKAGMQAGELLDNQDKARNIWITSGLEAIKYAKQMADMEIHKQYANRILEPYSHISVVCTATEFSNFFALRHHSAAQPEIQALAKAMWDKYSTNTPKNLKTNEWHLPFVTEEEINVHMADCANENKTSFEQCWLPLIKRSVARCARVSYLTHDNLVPSYEQDCKLYDRLLGAQPIHASPAEHQGKAMESADPLLKPFMGNFNGFVQYRKYLENENIVEFKGPLG